MKEIFNNRFAQSRAGSKSPTSKLKEAEVIAMRKDLSDGMLVKDAAIKYKISTAVVYKIRLRKAWTHI